MSSIVRFNGNRVSGDSQDLTQDQAGQLVPSNWDQIHRTIDQVSGVVRQKTSLARPQNVHSIRRRNMQIETPEGTVVNIQEDYVWFGD